MTFLPFLRDERKALVLKCAQILFLFRYDEAKTPGHYCPEKVGVKQSSQDKGVHSCSKVGWGQRG
jgi:hypothetical protein